MKQVLGLFFSIWLCCLAGCAWFDKKPSIDEGMSSYVESGKIVKKERLSEGGKLLIVPFKAGSNVEATDQLDKIALMVVKGISDTLKEQSSHIQVVSPQDGSNHQLILKGYVIDMGEPSNIGKWLLGKKKIELAVQGRLIDQSTNETVLYFTDRVESKKSDGDHKQLGYLIGQNVGRFIALETN